ncbi:MAG: ROK family protein [Acidobacteriota bacterium]
MDNNKVIGIDVGGTKISAGLIVNGEILKNSVVPTGSKNKKEKILENLFKTINDVVTSDVKAIGIGVPGIIDSKNGVVIEVNNIPSWNGLHLKQVIENKYKISTYVANDANCFVLGVRKFGVGSGYKNIVGVTLGTGVGTGIIINGSLYTGLENGTGEYGMVRYEDSNLETYCSGRFFKSIKGVDGKDVYLRALKGERDALSLWEEYGNHLGELVKTILYTIAPEIIVFGGSVSNGYPFFIKSMKKSLEASAIKHIAKKVIIKKAESCNNAVLGAAALCYPD